MAMLVHFQDDFQLFVKSIKHNGIEPSYNTVTSIPFLATRSTKDHTAGPIITATAQTQFAHDHNRKPTASDEACGIISLYTRVRLLPLPFPEGEEGEPGDDGCGSYGT
jgi:hypothetical protein